LAPRVAGLAAGAPSGRLWRWLGADAAAAHPRVAGASWPGTHYAAQAAVEGKFGEEEDVVRQGAQACVRDGCGQIEVEAFVSSRIVA